MAYFYQPSTGLFQWGVMKKMIPFIARSSRLALLGMLPLLAAASPASAGPTFIYLTYLGGTNHDTGTAVAVRNGETYIAGTTHSLDYPVMFPPSGLSSSKPSGDEYTRDVFVTRLGPSGIPFYSTYVRTGPNHNSV